MRALVTGGAGFIGSHLTDTLLADGHDVVVLDDFSTGRLQNVAHLLHCPRFVLVPGSVADDTLVGRLVDRCDVVFHLAAAVGVRLVVDRPLHTIRSNILGTEVVLRQVSRRGLPVVVASTSEVYGKGAALPFREDADLVLGPPTRRRWGYAASKLADEFLAQAYWQEHGLPVVIARLFNTVGPRQNNRYGMVLPTFVRRALAREPIVVHGDGSQTRSFAWVGDVAAALVALAREPRAAGQVFNVGNDQEVSIRELARLVRACARSDSRIQLIPYHTAFDEDFEDMPRRVPDLSKLRALVGSRPAVPLPEIVARTIDYWRTGRQTAEPADEPIEVVA